MCTAVLFIIGKNWKQPVCPLTDKYALDKHTVVYVYSGIVLSIKNRNNDTCTDIA